MAAELFPPLPLESWQGTRDTLQKYAQTVGKVRRALTARQKHWWHLSLRLTANGLTTAPMLCGACTLEIIIDFTRHKVILLTSKGDKLEIPLQGQSAAAFGIELVDALDEMGVSTPLQRGEFVDDEPGTYDQTAVAPFWQALSQIDQTLKTFRAGMREETGPVRLWPHHFDIAFLWFSGRQIPDQDPIDAANADEQMSFGFTTGDDAIPEPYFYVTAYPQPAQFTSHALPDGAYWYNGEFTAAILPYAWLVGTPEPREKLLRFLQTAFRAGARWMR